MQEQVYSWRLREDPFAGISDDAKRKDLRERLVDRLAETKPPGERRLAVLEDFVAAAEAAIDSGVVSRIQRESPSEDESEDEEGDRVEVNPLLALTLHMKWLLACFRDRPAISVSVR